MTTPSTLRLRGESLARVIAAIVIVETLALLALAIAGWVNSDTMSPHATETAMVIGFELNTAHSLILGATGLAGLIAVWRARYLRWFLVLQTLGYLAFWVVGVTSSGARGTKPTFLALNLADHLLHLGLFALGLILGLLMVTASAETRAEG